MTVSDPIERARCVGTAKSTGERCRRPPVPGATVCVKHGGGAPQVQAAARRRLLTKAVEADANAVLAHEGITGVDDPVELLTRVCAEIVAFKDALAQRINALDHVRYRGTQGEQLRAEVALYERALDRTVKAAEVLAKLDLEGKRQAAAERYGLEIASALNGIFAALMLTEQQWQRVPQVVATVLSAELTDVASLPPAALEQGDAPA